MSHPFQELRNLLSPTRRRVRGTVVAVAQGKAKVRTRSGIGSYLVNGLSVAPGSDVYVAGGGVISVVSPPSSSQIYDV
jgi:hypothetical protein